MFESHHVSRHFEKRCKESQRQARKKQRQADAVQRQARKKAAKVEANRRRARVVKRLPKLSLAVHAASHLILAARATTGMGADHAHFVPLLRQAKTRMRVAVALADAGYDSQANHQMARQILGVRSLIPLDHRPTGSRRTRGPLSPAHAATTQVRPGQKVFRATLASGNGQQHDQTELGFGLPVTNAPRKKERYAPASGHAQSHDYC